METSTSLILHKCGHRPSANGLQMGTLAVTQSICYNCKHKQLNDSAAIASKQAKLPDLAGSQRQTPWATTIRADKLPGIRDVLTRLLKSIESQTDAEWWINRRDMAALDIVATEFLALTPRIASSLLPPVLNAPQDAPEDK